MIFFIRAHSQVLSQDNEYASADYDEDFESTVTSHSKTQLTSENSSSVTLISDTSQPVDKELSTLNQPTAKQTILNESGSSISSSTYSETRLLDRSNTKQQFTSQPKQDASLLLAMQPSSSNGLLDKDKENLSTHSSLEDSERRLSLTPIHTKDFVSAQRKGHLLQTKRDSLDNVTLSPLHKSEKAEEEMTLFLPKKSPTPPLSPVREPPIATPIKQSTVSSSQHVLIPHLKTNNSSIPESYEPLKEKIPLDASEQVKDKLPLDASVNVDKSLLLDNSMITEFNELQDALKAAGLPQIADSEPPPRDNSPNIDNVREETMSPLPQKRVLSPNVTASQPPVADPSVYVSTNSILKDNKLQNSTKDSEREWFDFQSQENVKKLYSTATRKQQFVEPRPLTTTAPSKKSVLREALRVIAGEELTSLTKGILYEEGRSKFSTSNQKDKTEKSQVEPSKSPIPLEVPIITVDQRESDRKPSLESLSKLTIRIPTGSLEENSKLEEELADILNDPVTMAVDYTQAPVPKRPQKQLQQKPPVKNQHQSNIGSVSRPFQVSSRLYPGPKAPPKTLNTKHSGPRAQKLTAGIRPPRKIKRIPKPKYSPEQIDTRQSPPEEMVTIQSPPEKTAARRGGGVCSECTVEKAECERWKKEWKEEKVYMYIYMNLDHIQ